MRVELTLPLPPSVNKTHSYVRSKGGAIHKVGSGAAVEYHEWVRIAVAVQRIAGKPKPPIRILIRYVMPAWNTLDIDNGTKAVIDSLKKALGFNDARVCRLFHEKLVLKSQKPSCHITLLDADEPSMGMEL